MAAITIGTSTDSQATLWSQGPKLVFASDGTACAIYQDGGTGLVFRAASSPYSTWGSATTVLSGSRRPHSAVIDGSDNVHVLVKDGSSQPTYIKLTKSGSTWTAGTGQTVIAHDGGSGSEAWKLVRDVTGRYWAIGIDFNSGTVWDAYYGTDGGTGNGVTTWTASMTAGTVTQSGGVPASWCCAVTGNYVLFVRASGPDVKWRRLDVTGTLTSWSTEQTAAGVQIWDNHGISLATDGSGRVVLAAWPQGTDYAIRTMVYTPGADTWSGTTDIGTGTGDKDPSVTPIGSDVYCLWSESAGTNNFALVHKVWSNSGGSFGSKVTDEASGANRRYAVGGGTSTIFGWIWTEGTGSPYNVRFDSQSVGGGPQDTPELYGAPRLSSRQMQQLLAQ